MGGVLGACDPPKQNATLQNTKIALWSCTDIRPLIHAPETGSRSRCHRPKFVARSGASFSCRYTTSNDNDCLQTPTLQRQSMTLEFVHLESGVKFRPMTPISGACVRVLRGIADIHLIDSAVPSLAVC